MSAIEAHLRRLSALAVDATPGPWEASEQGVNLTIVANSNGLGVIGVGDPSTSPQVLADATLIAAARTALPSLAEGLQFVMRLHAPVWTYRLADECGHDDDGGPEYAEAHPVGATDDPICLESPTSHPLCAECGEDDGSGDHDVWRQQFWPCTTVLGVARCLGVDPPAVVLPTYTAAAAPQTEQFDLAALGAQA